MARTCRKIGHDTKAMRALQTGGSVEDQPTGGVGINTVGHVTCVEVPIQHSSKSVSYSIVSYSVRLKDLRSLRE